MIGGYSRLRVAKTRPIELRPESRRIGGGVQNLEETKGYVLEAFSSR